MTMYNFENQIRLALPMIRPPEFSPSIEDFIKQRAIRDLPKEQFEGKIDRTNPKHLVELWGMLDYRENGDIIELGYAEPKYSKSIIRNGKIVGTEAEHSYYDMDDFENMEHLISYHSHPYSDGEVFIYSDIEHVTSQIILAELLIKQGAPIKDLHFALFLPEKDAFEWFKGRLMI